MKKALTLGVLALAIFAVSGTGAAAGPAWCGGWTMQGNATCSGGTMTAGDFGCFGDEPFGDIGAASATVAGAPVVSIDFDYTLFTADALPFDGIFVEVSSITGDARVTVNPHPTYGDCVTVSGHATIGAGVPSDPTGLVLSLLNQFPPDTGPFAMPIAMAGCAVSCTITIGVFEDAFGDLTAAQISNVVVA